MRVQKVGNARVSQKHADPASLPGRPAALQVAGVQLALPRHNCRRDAGALLPYTAAWRVLDRCNQLKGASLQHRADDERSLRETINFILLECSMCVLDPVHRPRLAAMTVADPTLTAHRKADAGYLVSPVAAVSDGDGALRRRRAVGQRRKHDLSCQSAAALRALDATR